MLQPLDQPSRRVCGVKMVEQAGREVAGRFLALEHLIGHDQDRVGRSCHGALPATPRREPPVLCLQIGALGPRGGEGRMR